VVGKSMTRVAQEVLLKQQSTSANLILGSLADAETNGDPHVMDQAAASIGFTLADFNKLVTKAKRINTAWTGGTPEDGIKGITDLLVSPETMEDLRAISYNPVNTVSNAGTAGVGGQIAAPDSYRDKVFANGGVPELYGIGLMEMNELGRSRKFCNLFRTFNTASTVSGKVTFDVNDDLVIGIDRSRESLIRAVATDSETGAEFSLIADDQYSNRQQKLGWFGSVEEGRMVVDNRVLTGVVVSGH
jgi:hypothetical protein